MRFGPVEAVLRAVSAAQAQFSPSRSAARAGPLRAGSVLMYSSFFSNVTSPSPEERRNPHPWQSRLGSDHVPRDRLVRIPTGFGKTAGVVVPWLYHRIQRQDLAWPNRLVFVLPMRVLVEQTLGEIRGWIVRMGADVDVHPLMGGLVEKEYAAEPHRPAILVGTQDMVLSRALMRGYAAGRGRWPIDFGLLHRDALWVLDEIQLMDTGLATSTQLNAFRAGAPATRPAFTWWMSATLQASWLSTVDFRDRVEPLHAEWVHIPDDERRAGLWEVEKAVQRDPVAEPKHIAAMVAAEHRPRTLTLVIANRVERAMEIHKLLSKSAPGVDLRLVHSRFRPYDRKKWAAEFLSRGASIPPEGRIVVATQVVEAGVDVSAALLVTDVAPWPSLVQRFGRAARYPGESARVVVVGGVPDDDKGAAPYAREELQGALEALADLTDVSPRSLEAFESTRDPPALARMYPYEPRHVLRRPDLDELFDTSADLTGTDIDVSRFIRSGEERDVTAFWRAVPADAPAHLGRAQQALPQRDELCAVPLARARDWLKKRRAWRWSYLETRWERIDDGTLARLAPGAIVLVAADEGGYDTARGFDKDSKKAVAPVPPSRTDEARLDEASAGAADDDLSAAAWKTIATHGREVADEVDASCVALGIPAAVRRLLRLAGRWHDLGKAHQAFQHAIRPEHRSAALDSPGRTDLAKAPDLAWKPPRERRPTGFRHELASGLALCEVLRRSQPGHRGLLGDFADLFAVDDANDLAGHPLASELAALTSEELDLVLWLVLTHHGKVRCALVPAHGDAEGRVNGVGDGDTLPPTSLAAESGTLFELPELDLRLELAAMGLGPRFGRSWPDRVAGLIERHGPFELAWYEAVFRAADVRASRLDTVDPLLSETP